MSGAGRAYCFEMDMPGVFLSLQYLLTGLVFEFYFLETDRYQ